jgi:hypothetical protein
MINIDYIKFGLLRSRMVWFGEELPTSKGYHFVSCYSYLADIPDHFPFTQFQEETVRIDLTKDMDGLFKQIHKRRRQKIRRGYKEDIEIKYQTGGKEIFKEFYSLHSKYRIHRGNDPVSLNNLLLPLSKYITVFTGHSHGQTLISEIIIHDGNIAYRFANARNERLIGPASTYIGGVLLWEVIMYFKRCGYQIIDLGGSNLFKRSFGGEIVTNYNYSLAISGIAKALIKVKPVYYSLLKQIYRRRKFPPVYLP